jgi:gliding motility-associated-like protein
MVVTLEQFNTGCPYECKAQVKANVEGGYPPYRYEWSADVAPNDSSTALGLCSNDEYALLVYDTVCIYDTTYSVESFDIPEIEITSEPKDSVYTVNPRVTFFYENKSADTLPITNFFWEFGDGTTSTETFPTHTFAETDTVKFSYTTIDGCDSAEYITIIVRELELEVPNVFTPNGDGVNDFFEVPNLDKYVSNELVIVNRWGQKVYEASNYDNDWDGDSNPDGTYFYILRAIGIFKEDVFRGTVTILGSGN